MGLRSVVLISVGDPLGLLNSVSDTASLPGEFPRQRLQDYYLPNCLWPLTGEALVAVCRASKRLP
jgi:hypothetical protein